MASSGRYQSRLFNFLHQQSRRLTENLRSATRHLQVSATWGVQLLLYPVYLLFQSKRAAGKQFHQTVQQSWPPLQADDISSQPQTSSPTADTPIQRVLLLVDVPLGNSPISNRPIVRGIATQLSSHTLVLVTAQNEILDILTPQQQQKLQERIIGEVAEYWRYQRLLHSDRRSQAYPSLQETGSLEYSPHTYQSLTFLDRIFAQLESNYLSPVSEVAITISQRSRDLVQWVQKLTVSLSSTQTLNIEPADNTSKANTLQIQALIWAAIDYFFGRRRGSELGQTTPVADFLEVEAGSKPSASLKLFSAELPPYQSIGDPWLSESDLFGAPESGGSPSTVRDPELSAQTMSPLVGKTKVPLSQSTEYVETRNFASVQNLLGRFQRLLQLNLASGLVKRQKTTKGSSTAVVPAPNWIETNATVMGYVKHPLEQLLAWLDRAMLWLEDVLIIVWRWLQQLLRGK